MPKKTKISKIQRVKLNNASQQDIRPQMKIAAEKGGDLKSPNRDSGNDVKESTAITKLKDEIQKLKKEHEDDIRTILELTNGIARQDELIKNEKNSHVSQIKETESKIQILTKRCDELVVQVKDAQTKYQECHNTLTSKEEHERALKEELSRTQWYLGEEKDSRRQAESTAQQKQTDLERHQENMRNLSNECNSLKGTLAECQWYLGEERALRQKAEVFLGESAAFIERQKNDLSQKQNDLDVVKKQFQESQWYLGEAQARNKTLEEQLSSAKKHSECLSTQISEIQEAFAKSNLLAAEWMRRWDRLVEEALERGGEIDREQIENGKFWERQLSFSRQEVEVLTANKAALEEQLKQVKSEMENLVQVNDGLLEELSSERRKYQVLEKNYAESEWYLNETRAKIQKMEGVTC